MFNSWWVFQTRVHGLLDIPSRQTDIVPLLLRGSHLLSDSHLYFNEMLIPGKLFHCLGWKCFYLCNIRVQALSTEIKPHSKSCIHKERERGKERKVTWSWASLHLLRCCLFMYNLKTSTQFHWLISMWFHYWFKSCQRGTLWMLWFHYKWRQPEMCSIFCLRNLQWPSCKKKKKIIHFK